MTSQEKSHLMAWIDRMAHPDHRVETYWRIVDFVREYPEVTQRNTWGEIDKLAISRNNVIDGAF